MNTQILDKMTEKLTRVFNNAAELAEYNDPADRSISFGWDGRGLSPVTRTAFINTYGLDTVEMAEEIARMKLAQNANTYGASHYAAHMKEAEANGDQVPTAGGFVLAVHTGLKCDDGRGIYGEIESATEHPDWIDEKEESPRLCKVVEVFNVTAEEFADPATADRLVMEARENGREFAGGAATDDADRRDIHDEYKYYYTVAAAVVCGSRWFLIDSEGYGYARYCLMPTTWREMFADIVAEEQKRIDARRAAEEKREAEEKAVRLADYVRRCEKYAPVMEDITELEKAEDEARRKESEAGSAHGYRSPQYKAAQKVTRAAGAALMAARKRNLTAMAATAYPGIKAKAAKSDKYYGAFTITYYDGPRLENFNESTDFELFRVGWIGSDYYGDTYNRAEFPEFAQKYMNMGYGSFETVREWSDDTRARLIADVVAVVPAAMGSTYGNAYEWKAEELRAICERSGANASYVVSTWQDSARYYNYITAENVARWCFDSMDFEIIAPTQPEKPRRGSKAAKGGDTKADTLETAQDITETAPAEGLELEDINGVLCVVGPSRVTFKNLKAIKAHGCTWNKPAKRWEARTDEARESCRQWFALRDNQAEPQTADTLETAQDITDPAEGTAKYYAAILNASEEQKAVLFRIARAAIVCANIAPGMWDMSNADGTGTQYELTTEEAADVLALDYELRDKAYELEDITRDGSGIDHTADGLEFRAVVVARDSGDDTEPLNGFLNIEEAHAARWYGYNLEADPADITNTEDQGAGAALLFECCRPEDAGTSRIAYGATYEEAARRYRAEFYGLRHALAELPEWLKVGTRFVLLDYKTGEPTKCAYTCTEINKELKTITTPETSDPFRNGSHSSPWCGWHWPTFAPLTDETTPDPSDDDTATAAPAASLESPAEITDHAQDFGDIVSHYDNPAPAMPDKAPAEMTEEERRQFLDGLFIHRVKAGFNRLQDLPICCECIQKLRAEGCDDMAKAFRSLVVFNAMLHPDWTDAQIFEDIYENLKKRQPAA